jgi:hypothetical protein
MAEPSSSDSTRWKIFPRNLTARADYLVPGNPMSSRPESGVNNSFPGLEFDQRTLDECFFPGLRFEFHRPDGAIVAAMPLTAPQRAKGLFDADSPPTRPLYLWYLYGRTSLAEPSAFMFHGQSGWEVGRRIRDLAPERVAIIVGPGQPPPFSSPFAEHRDVVKHLKDAYDRGPGAVCDVSRDQDTGLLQRVLLAGDRARYLDENGVIDPEVYPPGELTKSMCAPWMYDFRDCYCFYWAANKPDLVDVADGSTTHHYVNFLRAHRGTPPPADVTTWTWTEILPDLPPMADGTPPKSRRDTELNYKHMVEGWWHQLPVVLNDREVSGPSPSVPSRTSGPDPLTLDETKAELGYLATVEHALVVEYLYAFYSMKASKAPPPAGPGSLEGRIFSAAQEIFRIAVDEMRHLLWVNELLRLLGATPSVGRADVVGMPPSLSSGRRQYGEGRKYLNREFALRPLCKETLEWFIQVEKPSREDQSSPNVPPGMYLEVLRSVTRRPERFPHPERLAALIRLIVDEGNEHYRRFVVVEEALHGIEEAQYLHAFTAPSPEHEPLLMLCDQYYESLLKAIHLSFAEGDRAGGEMAQAAIKSMQNFDDVARRLARVGVAPRFVLPAELSPTSRGA